MKIFLLSILIALVVAGCTTPIISTQVVKPYIPALPARVEFKPVEWKVINVDTNAYFALDAEGYKNLSQNFVIASAYLEKVRTILYSVQNTNLSVTVTNKSTISLLPKFF